MGLPQEGWFSLPASARFAGASEQPRAPAPTVAAWPPPPARGSAPPPPPSGVRMVSSLPELSDSDLLEDADVAAPIARLREDVGDLEILGNTWQAAAFSAAVLLKTLHARAVIIHAIHEPNAELRIIGVKGAETSELLGEITALDDDFVGSTVASNGRPLTMKLEGELPRVLPMRFRTVRASSSLVAAPIIEAGRCVGLIEVIDVHASNGAIATEACELVAKRLVSLFLK